MRCIRNLPLWADPHLRAVVHRGEELGLQRSVVAETLGASCRSGLAQLRALHLKTGRFSSLLTQAKRNSPAVDGGPAVPSS